MNRAAAQRFGGRSRRYRWAPEKQCARRRRAAAIMAAVLGAVGLGACSGGADGGQGGPGPVAGTGIRYLAGGGQADDGYERALQPREFVFPDDHGPHPDYRTEWWYFTGNVASGAGRHFGFELTVFRIALAPEAPDSDSAWATRQLYMAHFAVTDTDGIGLVAAERFSRGALGLAVARADPFELRVEDWSVQGRLGRDAGSLALSAGTERAQLELTLEPRKPVVANGDRGLDAKGPEPGNASYYYSMPRLAATGRVRVGDADWVDVSGRAWMDREWSTSALSDGISGWDWFALQLDDGRDLMLYRLRRDDGLASRFSGGTLVSVDGTARHLGADDFDAAATRDWRSRLSGVTYPVAWRLDVPSAGLHLAVEPVIDAQELELSVRYWEGAVRVIDRGEGSAVIGSGYLELAGY